MVNGISGVAGSEDPRDEVPLLLVNARNPPGRAHENPARHRASRHSCYIDLCRGQDRRWTSSSSGTRSSERHRSSYRPSLQGDFCRKTPGSELASRLHRTTEASPDHIREKLPPNESPFPLALPFQKIDPWNNRGEGQAVKPLVSLDTVMSKAKLVPEEPVVRLEGLRAS